MRITSLFYGPNFMCCMSYVSQHFILFIPILILSILAELKKVTVSFIMSVCLSICMEQLSSHWMDF
jgi:hypothetical protein